MRQPSKHNTPTQCWLNVGAASQTMVQHWSVYMLLIGKVA